ncbi:MAG: threonine/serine exporter [Subdoligranulum sp.]|nr:threonine/serine exporter [Subdoligranulum sp.]
MRELCAQCIVAFLATVSFAVLVNAPRSEFLCAGITGTAGWLVYCLCLRGGFSAVGAVFLAALALAFVSRIFAVARQCPATVFLISGIFALVPGAGVYYMAYYFIQGDNQAAFESGFGALQVAIALAVGIVLVMALPGRLFRVLAPGKQGRK